MPPAAIAATFAAPDDFGFQHDIDVAAGRRASSRKDAFSIDMTVKLLADNGPVGTPIPIEVQGIGWRELEGSWVLLYDNRFTGWMSTVTTGGTARFTLPATGLPGRHVIEVVHSDFTFPYRNMQQSPAPDRPQFKVGFTITKGAPVLPPPPPEQATGAGAPAAAPGRAGGDAGLLRRRTAGDGERLGICSPASPWRSTGRPSPATASAAARRAPYSLE